MRISCVAAGMLLAVVAVTVEWTQRSDHGQAATVTVDANASFAFAPQDITIAVGDTVQWTVSGGGPHNVTSDGSPSFTGSGTLNVSDTYSVAFNSAGVFIYYCSFHAISGQYPGSMTGRITVQAVATPTATNTAAAPTSTLTRTPTRTATGTPQATATPSATTTAPAATTTPVVAAPISATQPAGEAAPSLTGPATGDGGATQGSGTSHAMSIVLATIGAVLIVGAASVRRRA